MRSRYAPAAVFRPPKLVADLSMWKDRAMSSGFGVRLFQRRPKDDARRSRGFDRAAPCVWVKRRERGPQLEGVGTG